MSIPILDACRKRKRKPNIYSFSNFSDPGYPISFTSDAFRDNVRVFLRQCATPEDHKIDGMSVSCTLLMHEGKNAVVPLYTIEENVKSSLNTFCNHCRCAGWSKNFLSKRRYHFVIPADENWNKPLDDGVVDDQTCLLHGLIHCNGYGHLICVNGAEGGSQFLFGKEIMDLWDRICTNLQTRKVTVEDVSKKRSMDLRLLHGVAYGHPWFGRWGYTFCRGSFGVSESNYVRAIDVLSSIELDSIVQDFGRGDGNKEMKRLVQSYRDLSETRLITVRDLLRTMLILKSRVAPQKKLITADTSSASSSSTPSWRASTRNSSQQHKIFAKEKPVKCRKFTNVAAHMDSRWPVRRLEYTAQIIVDTLKEKKLDRFSHSGMTRQEVRDAARMHIGDTGLLDYVLKAMNNVMIGGYIVRRVVNPITRILEYSLHEHNGVLVNVDEPEPEVASDKHSLSITSTRHGSDVYDDIVYLYTTVLLAYPDSKLIELAIQVVLDSKLFVKVWPFCDGPDYNLRYICRVVPCSIDSDELKREWVIGEPITVDPYATVGDLKTAVEIAMRDTYCIMEDMVVTEIEELEGVDDEEVLFCLTESGSEIWARGIGMDMGTEMKYEGGSENWVVRCECGARDDDGERMIACDICEVWLHTVCCGIEDSEAVPPLFVCHACARSLVPSRNDAPALGFHDQYPQLSEQRINDRQYDMQLLY